MKQLLHLNFRQTAISISLALTVSGCASTSKTDSRDPWEGWNRGVQSVNDTLDDYFMKPVAKGYQWITPSIVDRGITNFFSNVDDISVVMNDLLQFKFLQSGMDVGRLLVNTTAGVGGFVDVASLIELPKHNEDLDQTLGAWGLPSGPYLVLPFIGPSTPRGALGMAGDTMANPINWITPAAIGFGSGVLKTIDTRADLLTSTKIVDEASVDRYEFIRNAYFQQRNYEIYDGNPPLEDDLELEMDKLDNSKNDSAEPENTTVSESSSTITSPKLSTEPKTLNDKLDRVFENQMKK